MTVYNPEYHRQYRLRNKELIKSYQRKYYIDNKFDKNATSRIHYQNNRQAINDRKKQKRLNDRLGKSSSDSV